MFRLFEMDPDATWDQTANGGRGGVINSRFGQSPRVILLPVFAPDLSDTSSATLTSAKFVGFFASHIENFWLHGYLTGWSQLTVVNVQAPFGETATLSASILGPGSSLVGMPVDFLLNDVSVGTAFTDEHGIANLSGVAVGELAPGTYPIKARLGEAGFFIADESTAVLTVNPPLPKAPLVAVSTTGTSVTLSWTPSPTGASVESYVVEAGTAAGASNLFNENVGLLTTLSATLAPGTYFARVRAVTAAGISPPSNEITFTLGPPGQPTVTSATVDTGVLMITWQFGAGPSPTSNRLEFFYGTVLVASLNTGPGTSIVIPIPLGIQGTFGVSVTGVNDAGQGPASALYLFSIAPQCVVLASPDVSGGVIAGTASIGWPAVAGATSYIVAAGTTPGATEYVAPTNIGATTTASVSGVPAGFTAWVRVVAVNACGQQGAPRDFYLQ